jgi:hypothetical protein
MASSDASSPSPKQQWLLHLLLVKRQPSRLLSLPRELLYQIISHLDAGSFMSLVLSSYLQFQLLLPDLVPTIPTYDWIVVRLLSRLINDPNRQLRPTYDRSPVSFPTELVLDYLEFMPRPAQIHFILAYWTIMVHRGIVFNLTDETVMKELVVAGVVSKRLGLGRA